MTANTDKGFSLIELMIAMVLGVLLTVGVVELYLDSSETYRLTEGVASIQENSRFVTDRLGHHLRQAEPGGCSFREALDPGKYFAEDSRRGEDGSIRDLRDLPSDWPLPEEAGVIGWESSETALSDAADGAGSLSNSTATDFPAGVNSGDFVGGSDVLIVQGSMGHAINLGTGGGDDISLDSPSDIAEGTTVELVSPDCSNGSRFINGSDDTESAISVAGEDLGNQAGININDDLVDNPNVSVHIFRSTLYYVGENPNGNPSLYRQTLNNPGNSIPSPQELVVGVENMQVLYGLGNENGATEYVTAADEDLDDWSDVVSVRLGFVMASAPRTRKTKETRTFNLLGTKITSPEDKRVRVVATKTVAFRNQLE